MLFFLKKSTVYSENIQTYWKLELDPFIPFLHSFTSIL